MVSCELTRRNSGSCLRQDPLDRGEPGGTVAVLPPLPRGQRFLQSRLPPAEEWALYPRNGQWRCQGTSREGRKWEREGHGCGSTRGVLSGRHDPPTNSHVPSHVPPLHRDTDLMGFLFLPCTPGSAQTWSLSGLPGGSSHPHVNNILKCEMNI